MCRSDKEYIWPFSLFLSYLFSLHDSFIHIHVITTFISLVLIFSPYILHLYLSVYLIFNVTLYMFKMELLFKIFYLFNFRGEEGEREGEKYLCARETLIGCLSHSPNQGLGLQSRNVPWPGIEPVTFLLAGWNPLSHTSEGKIIQLFFNYLSASLFFL